MYVSQKHLKKLKAFQTTFKVNLLEGVAVNFSFLMGSVEMSFSSAIKGQIYEAIMSSIIIPNHEKVPIPSLIMTIFELIQINIMNFF